MTDQELKDKIKENQERAKKLYSSWLFGLIKRYVPWQTLEKDGLEISYNEWDERFYGSDGYEPSGSEASIKYKGEDVLSISGSWWVNYYTPGAWEKLIPGLVKKASAEEKKAEKYKKQREQEKEREALEAEAKRFGVTV